MNALRALRHKLTRTQVEEVDPLPGYNRWAKQYAHAKNPVLALEQDTLKPLLPQLAGKQVLDVACGTGRVTKMIAEREAALVAALDFSFAMLDEARREVGQMRQVRLLAAEALALPFHSAIFDVLTCSLMLGHIADLNDCMAEFARVVKPGGDLVISDFHPFGQLLGWHRSFREETSGHVSEVRIRYWRHLHEAYFDAFKQAGLEIEDLREPRLDKTVEHYFEHSSESRDNYRKFYGYPLVILFRLRRHSR